MFSSSGGSRATRLRDGGVYRWVACPEAAPQGLSTNREPEFEHPANAGGGVRSLAQGLPRSLVGGCIDSR